MSLRVVHPRGLAGMNSEPQTISKGANDSLQVINPLSMNNAAFPVLHFCVFRDFIVGMVYTVHAIHGGTSYTVRTSFIDRCLGPHCAQRWSR